MTNSLWILTTTTEDGQFDIFEFNRWLQSATLADLHLRCNICDEIAAIEIALSKQDGDLEHRTAQLYRTLKHFIRQEIFRRSHCRKSQHEN